MKEKPKRNETIPRTKTNPIFPIITTSHNVSYQQTSIPIHSHPFTQQHPSTLTHSQDKTTTIKKRYKNTQEQQKQQEHARRIRTNRVIITDG